MKIFKTFIKCRNSWSRAINSELTNLAPKHDSPWYKQGVRVCLDPVVELYNMEQVHSLSLVLVDTLHLGVGRVSLC